MICAKNYENLSKLRPKYCGSIFSGHDVFVSQLRRQHLGFVVLEILPTLRHPDLL